MEENTRKNPWLGLESYREGEVLYGRDDDIRDLTQCVLNDADTLLYGKSGIGKSSILNAGIIPAARRNGYVPVLVRFSHKGEDTYLQQIHHAISHAATPALHIREEVPCRDPQQESLYEFFHRHTFHTADGERVKLLIIFDQFEEIFTLQSDEGKKKRFFVELADLLNDIMPAHLQQSAAPQDDTQQQTVVETGDDFDDLFSDIDLGTKSDMPNYVTDNDIHLVFTIREDFLSEFEYYSASIPSLKQNRYGLRPINEEQAAQIILRPMPGLITVEVARLIIEKVTGRTDFDLDGIPEIEVDSAVLSLYLNRLYEAKTGDTITSELVEQKGGEIIADFYLDAISDIRPATIEYLEDMLLNGQGRRDNITVFDAKNDGGATEAELDLLCNKKKILRQFNYAGDLRVEYVHDILCPVVKAHKEERLMLKQQEEERIRQEEEKRELVKKQERELARIKRENEKQKKKNMYRFAVVFALLVAGLLSGLGWYFVKEQSFKAAYAAFTTENGWPVGIGEELQEGDKAELTVYYQLVRKGYFSKTTRVNVMNGKKKPSLNKFRESPLVGMYEAEGDDEKAKDFAVMQRQTSYWIYTPDNDGNVLRKTAYGADNKELYAVQYFRSSAMSADGSEEISQKKQLWATYVDKDGKSMRVRDNGADRVRIINDSLGHIVGYQFYSETGTPQSNAVGAYGYRYQLDEMNRIVKRTPVDAFGDLIEQHSTTYKTFDAYNRWIVSSRGKAEYTPKLVVFKMDNRTDSLKFSDQGELQYHSETANNERRTFQYEKEQIVQTLHYRTKGAGLELAHSRTILPQKNPNVKETLVYWADSTMQYRLKREETKGMCMTIAYYAGNSSASVNTPILENKPEGKYHKLVSDTIQEGGFKKVTKKYYDTEGKLSPWCRYNQDIAYYNKNDEMRKHIVYKDSLRVFAYLNDYTDGLVTAISVLGIDDSTPIRCAAWDDNGFCYYKMKVVYNYSNTLVAVKGVNEFGEESLVTTSDDENFVCNILPSMEMEGTNAQGDDIYGLQMYTVRTTPVDKNRRVEYIHMKDMNATWYKAGVRDGDLLVSDGNPVVVARPNPSAKTYDIKSFSVQAGERGAEHYPVYFTEREMERYDKAVRTYKK